VALIDKGRIEFRGAPAELVQRAAGKVFEVQTQGADVGLPDGVEVVSRVRDANGTRIRAVAPDGSIPSGARPAANPTLEEAYLAFMAGRGRGVAALQEAEEVAP
jgi:hypothetical protein